MRYFLAAGLAAAVHFATRSFPKRRTTWWRSVS